VAVRIDDLSELRLGPLRAFADWPDSTIPNWRAGVYTIWDGDSLVYVGMAGRGLEAGAHDSELARASSKRKGLRDRLNSHASGRRSGDQFCVYVFDRLVLPSLSADQMRASGLGTFSLDAATRSYIREHLTYRYVVTEDAAAASSLEREIQLGALGDLPLLNPRRQGSRSTN
jgi:hypothetical protein